MLPVKKAKPFRTLKLLLGISFGGGRIHSPKVMSRDVEFLSSSRSTAQYSRGYNFRRGRGCLQSVFAAIVLQWQVNAGMVHPNDSLIKLSDFLT
jgi:hypothetical protein